MLKKAIWLTAVLLIVPVMAAAVHQQKRDPELLQGKWVVESVEVNGQPAPKQELDHFKALEITVIGDKAIVKDLLKGEKIPEIHFKIDPSTKPKSVDFKIKDGDHEENFKGIYSLEGDTLTLCVSDPKGGRPTEFTTKEKSQRILGVLKRKK